MPPCGRTAVCSICTKEEQNASGCPSCSHLASAHCARMHWQACGSTRYEASDQFPRTGLRRRFIRRRGAIRNPHGSRLRRGGPERPVERGHHRHQARPAQFAREGRVQHGLLDQQAHRHDPRERHAASRCTESRKRAQPGNQRRRRRQQYPRRRLSSASGLYARRQRLAGRREHRPADPAARGEKQATAARSPVVFAPNTS